MSQLPIELPTIQNWNCHNCGGCCRQHGIFITAEEKKRIEGQGWENSTELRKTEKLIVEKTSLLGKKTYRLAQQPDGACVFLDEHGLCRIHGKFGEPAKPLACRIYPYAFHPKGNQITVSLRFSCPSVTQNLGQPIRKQKEEIRSIAELVVPQSARQIPPPKVLGKTQLDWPDTLQIVNKLDRTFDDTNIDIGVKTLRAVAWVDLIRQTNFALIRGERLAELLDLIVPAIEQEITELPAAVEPTSIAMMQFRLLAGQYARKDTFSSADTSLAGRLRQLTSALALTSGSGLLPKLNSELRQVPFASLQGSFGEIPEESQELLTRYFRVKIRGMHFCGPAFYGMNLVEGFQSLAVVLPVVIWIARWRAVTQSRSHLTAEDIREALQIVDHQHGYSDVFGTWGSKKRVATLTQSGQLTRLISWFAQ